MEALTINTQSKYDVLLGRGLLERTGELSLNALRGRRVLIVSDDNVAPLYMERVLKSYERAGYAADEYVVPHGEHTKSLDAISGLLEFAAGLGLTRADAFVALGGGVIGDLTGLAAALYMRGIELVQLPTTLLAMVDSSVGGKTAVNLAAGKNLCGAFYQPKLVVCDVDALDTLPSEIYAEGMAEVIKYGAICSSWILDEVARGGDMTAVIRECVRIKGDIVARDERDLGLRQLLNFGHTFGHAIEKLSGFALYHGDAVGIGMLIAAWVSQRNGWCAGDVYSELLRLLGAQALPLGTHFSAADIAAVAMSDKKKQGARLTLVLPVRRGECALREIEAAQLEALIKPCEGVVTSV